MSTEESGSETTEAGKRRPWVMIAVGVSLVIGWATSGDLIYHSLIGLDSSFFPAGEWIQSTLAPGATKAVGGIVLGVVILLLLGGFFFVLSRREAPTRPDGRRAFLAGSAAGASAFVAGLAGALGHTLFGVGKHGGGWLDIQSKISGDTGVVKTHPNWDDAWKGARVESYGRLGRTEWPISDTVLGAGRIREANWKIVTGAFDRGINYIDTAPDYSVEGSELAVGRALKEIPRDEVFLATKFCTPIGHLPAGTPVEKYKSVIEESLTRMGTDYVDLVHIHSCDEVERLMDPNVHEAFVRLKDEGKARFLGVSTHTPRLEPVANQAIDSGRFDVMMLAYHHGIWPHLGSIIDRAHDEQDMGIVAMKTLKGARHRNLEDFHDANSYAQAALKWVHSNPKVSCAVISFFEMQHLDEYLFASGKQITNEDLAILERYDRGIIGSYCAPHCGACLDSCPEGVPIADVLRHRMYFEDYKDERNAMELYAKLPVNASACDGCSAPCLGSCPVGIDIADRVQGAHELLTFGA
ncbi:MAG: aldo/keto reductase [bacterium]|nr:aldo/keto reductase [bacterium]